MGGRRVNNIQYQLSKTEEEEVVRRTNAEIATVKGINPRMAREIAVRNTLEVIKARRPEPTGTMHERLVMALGKVTLSQVFSPLERELLTILLDAVEPLYRPTPPKESEENAIRAAEIEALSDKVRDAAVAYVTACHLKERTNDKYAAIDSRKVLLEIAVKEYREAMEEAYG
jgi:hypothetical protein